MNCLPITNQTLLFSSTHLNFPFPSHFLELFQSPSHVIFPLLLYLMPFPVFGEPSNISPLFHNFFFFLFIYCFNFFLNYLQTQFCFFFCQLLYTFLSLNILCHFSTFLSKSLYLYCHIYIHRRVDLDFLFYLHFISL